MKAGDIVKIVDGYGGHTWMSDCVVLMVTPKMIRQGVNAGRPGLHLFRGYWYGSDPMNVRSYGKIEGSVEQNKDAVYVGRVQSHEQIKKMEV